MNEATVTSRMPAATKAAAQKIFEQSGTNASKMIYAFFERVIEEGSVSFLYADELDKEVLEQENLNRAIAFVDSIPEERNCRFDGMTKSEIKMQRLKDRGLL